MLWMIGVSTPPLYGLTSEEVNGTGPFAFIAPINWEGTLSLRPAAPILPAPICRAKPHRALAVLSRHAGKRAPRHRSGIHQTPHFPHPMHGREWLVEAHGCDPAALADVDTLRRLFDRVVRELALHPVAPAQWHRFPGPGGVTGLCMLAESHLACHTFPEHGSICLNLFCCRPRPEWDWEGELRALLGAAEVTVRAVERPYAAVPALAG
jgi:S-adenosylmethionine decarboxylase